MSNPEVYPLVYSLTKTQLTKTLSTEILMYIQCPHCNAIFTLPGSIDASSTDAQMRCGECSTAFHIAAHITTAPEDPSQPHFNFDQVLSGEEQANEASFFDTAATSEDTIYDNLEDTIELVVDRRSEAPEDEPTQASDSLADTLHDLPFEVDATTTLFLDETNQTSVDDKTREKLSDSKDEWVMPKPVTQPEQPKDNKPEDAFEEFIRKNQIEPDNDDPGNERSDDSGITSKQSGQVLDDSGSVLPDIDTFDSDTQVESPDMSIYEAMKPSDTHLAENDTETPRSSWDDVPTLDNLQLITETEVEAAVQSKQSGNDPLQTSAEPTNTAVEAQPIFETDEDELKKQASLALEIQEDLLDEGFLYEDDYIPLLDGAGNPLQEITSNTNQPEETDETLDDGEFTPADTLISLKKDDFLAAENTYTPQKTTYDNKHIGLFAGLAAILALILGGQYIYNNRLDLVSSPSARPLVAGVCKIAGCDLYAARLPHLIETLSKSTYKHAQKENILVIEATLRNTANRPQPYPVFEVQFSDINLNTVAFRRFGPSEYLPFLPNDGLMDSNETVELRIEVADPGQQSTSFKFNYL